ncbi:MAG: hypothetical protein ABI678_17145 [Kofleriaceae bacterium]
MTTAIVTITCPSCGGRVEGLRATNADQTLRCPYCRTELHVPRVGEVVRERVVREVIREVPMTSPVIDPDLNCMPSRRDHPFAGLVVGAVALLLLVTMVCVQHHDGDAILDDMHARDDAQDACRVRCEASCVSAGDKETLAELGTEETVRVMKEADFTLCEVDCQQQHACIGLSPHERERLLHH